MPEHARRFSAALYDQQNEDQVADWGGDDLFTRMPRPRVVDDAPAPRFRPSLALVDPPAEQPAAAPPAPSHDAAEQRAAASPAPRRASAEQPPAPRRTAEESMRERAARVGLTLVDDEPVGADEAGEPAASDDTPRPDATTGWDPAIWEAATSATVRQWDGELEADERAANGRRTKVITGRPDGAPRPRPLTPAARRRPPRTPAEWIGPRPERIVAWAFVLGLLLILVAISTADAAVL